MSGRRLRGGAFCNHAVYSVDDDIGTIPTERATLLTAAGIAAIRTPYSSDAFTRSTDDVFVRRARSASGPAPVKLLAIVHIYVGRAGHNAGSESMLHSILRERLAGVPGFMRRPMRSRGFVRRPAS